MHPCLSWSSLNQAAAPTINLKCWRRLLLHRHRRYHDCFRAPADGFSVCSGRHETSFELFGIYSLHHCCLLLQSLFSSLIETYLHLRLSVARYKIRRESAKEERADVFSRQKRKARTVVKRGEGRLLCDPGSELRLKGKVKGRAKRTDGKKKTIRKVPHTHGSGSRATQRAPLLCHHPIPQPWQLFTATCAHSGCSHLAWPLTSLWTSHARSYFFSCHAATTTPSP